MHRLLADLGVVILESLNTKSLWRSFGFGKQFGTAFAFEFWGISNQYFPIPWHSIQKWSMHAQGNGGSVKLSESPFPSERTRPNVMGGVQVLVCCNLVMVFKDSG